MRKGRPAEAIKRIDYLARHKNDPQAWRVLALGFRSRALRSPIAGDALKTVGPEKVLRVIELDPSPHWGDEVVAYLRAEVRLAKAFEAPDALAPSPRDTRRSHVGPTEWVHGPHQLAGVAFPRKSPSDTQSPSLASVRREDRCRDSLRFGVGDKVRIAGETNQGTSGSRPGQTSGSTIYYLVQVGGDEDGAYYQKTTLFGQFGGRNACRAGCSNSRSPPPGPFAEFFTIRKLRTRLSDHLYSYLASRTIFRIYQFKPVLKLLDIARAATAHRGRSRPRQDDRGGAHLERARSAVPRSSESSSSLPPGLRTKWQRRWSAGSTARSRSSSDVRHLADFSSGCDKVSASRFTASSAWRRCAPPSRLEMLRDELHRRSTSSSSTRRTTCGTAQRTARARRVPVGLVRGHDLPVGHTLEPRHDRPVQPPQPPRRPEDFDTDAIFDQLLEPNESINRALRQLTSTFRRTGRRVPDALPSGRADIRGRSVPTQPAATSLHMSTGSAVDRRRRRPWSSCSETSRNSTPSARVSPAPANETSRSDSPFGTPRHRGDWTRGRVGRL